MINGLALVVYLPNCQPVHFTISKSATVEETIERVLQLHNGKQVSSSSSSSSSSSPAPASDKASNPPLLGTSSCYELRLHEENGMPEEDFPGNRFCCCYCCCCCCCCLYSSITHQAPPSSFLSLYLLLFFFHTQLWKEQEKSNILVLLVIMNIVFV